MRKRQTSRRPVFNQVPAQRRQWMATAVVLSLTLRTAPGQEALRYPTAVQTPPNKTVSTAAEGMPYTMKAGDFRMLLTPSLSLGWNDNVYTTRTDRKSDFILEPVLDAKMSYPLTARNQLSLDAGVGYDKYFTHDDLSTWLLRSGSQLAFDAYIKDLWINVHDRFEYVRDSAREAAVARSAQYGNVDNLAGLLTTWNLEDVVLSAGYDHENVFSPASEFQNQDRSSELFVGRAGFKLNPQIVAGPEATGAITTYDHPILNDNQAFSVGAYGIYEMSPSFRIQSRAGYTPYHFQHTSRTIETTDVNSWYADLTITHQTTEAVSYSLSGGHEARLGVEADMIEDYYVRPVVSWNFARDWNLDTGFGYEHGRQGAGNVSGNTTETYDWFNGDIRLSHWIMKKLRADIGYRLTVRCSTDRSREYLQDLVRLNLTYQFR